MSATKRALEDQAAEIMAARGIPADDVDAFLETMSRIMQGGGGYICKTCGGPSPMGVGYPASRGLVASLSRVACDCGASFSYLEHVERMSRTDPATYAAIAAGDYRADSHVVAAILYREGVKH